MSGDPTISLRIGAKKLVPIEVDEMIRCVRDPDFRFPSDVFHKFSESFARQECRHENDAGFAFFCQLFKLKNPSV